VNFPHGDRHIIDLDQGEMRETISKLAVSSLFRGLPREILEQIAQIAVEQTFRRGQVLFSEGDEARGFFVVTQGRIKVFKLSSEGKEQTLHILGQGEPVGEVAVFSGESFPASAQAMEETKVLFFPKEPFMELIRRDPSIALRMLAVLAKRLRKFTALIEDLSLKEVPSRLASYLLEHSDSGQRTPQLIRLSISKAQLASLLGTIPETLSRILARMEREGLIELEGTRGIRIMEMAGLEELAQGARRLS
jgi:CRP-like cAMP-binding protein